MVIHVWCEVGAARDGATLLTPPVRDDLGRGATPEAGRRRVLGLKRDLDRTGMGRDEFTDSEEPDPLATYPLHDKESTDDARGETRPRTSARPTGRPSVSIT